MRGGGCNPAKTPCLRVCFCVLASMAPSRVCLTPPNLPPLPGGRRYVSALRTCFAATGQELVGFERYMALRKSGGNHCHLNAIAVPGGCAGWADCNHLPPLHLPASR